MPRQEHVLSVFVASPSDVSDERIRLEEVIKELNVTWSRDLAIRLELVMWETHAFPEIGADAQSVINRQIADDYDLFIGIMWCRYGTPTGRTGSGTIEEFERARARFNSDNSSVKLMMYFKDEPISPSKIDFAQLAKVNEFRQFVERNGLYFPFSDISQFEKLVRIHLSRQVQEWHARIKQSTGFSYDSPRMDQKGSEQDAANDVGILDLVKIYEECFRELVDTMTRMSEASEVLTEKINRRTDEIKTIVGSTGDRPDTRIAKRLVSLVAGDLEQYATLMEAEVPLYSETFSKGMTAIIQSISMSADFTNTIENAEQMAELIRVTSELRVVSTRTENQIQQFSTALVSIPRMTRELNIQKSRVITVLDRLIKEFSGGQLLLTEIESACAAYLHNNVVVQQ